MTDTLKTVQALAPCPFCGQPAELIDRESGPLIRGAFIECSDCGTTQPIAATASEAVSAWNRRALIAQMQRDAVQPSIRYGTTRDAKVFDTRAEAEAYLLGVPNPEAQPVTYDNPQDLIASLRDEAQQDDHAGSPAPSARAIHYPECWDTAAYPTLESALVEVYATFRCTNEDTHPSPAKGTHHEGL